MKKLLQTSIVSLASLGLAFSVFAQSPTPVSTSSPQATPTPTKTPIREQIKDIRNIRKEGMEDIKKMRALTKEEMGNLRKEFQDKIRAAQADLKTKIEAKRAQLKQDLKKVKDERKKQVTERVDQNLDALNQRMTNHFVEVLNKLEDVLVRIDERTDRAEASRSIDVSSVRLAIASASKSIDDARAAVAVQAGKTYKITVTTDPGLKDAVKKSRQALHDDLVVLRDKVKAARNAVHDAARAFAKAHGRDIEDLEESPSPTPTTTP